MNKSTIINFLLAGFTSLPVFGQLTDIQKAESDVLGLGYQIFAISPDSPERLKQSGEKQKLQYSLYSGMLTKSSGGFNEGFLLPF